MFEVVSCPAMSSSPAMPISSSVLRSSPVVAHEHAEHVVARRRLRPRDEVRHVLAALPAQLEALVHRQRDVEQLAGALLERLAVGVGHARAARRSPATGSAARSRRRGPQGGPAFSIASRWSSTISTIRGSSRRIRRTVNSGVSIRRRRVCSGGSTPSRLPARIRSRSSALSFGAPGASKARRLSLLNRALSASTALTSACRATRNAGIPKAVSTCRTPSSSRSAAISGTGRSPRAACAAASRAALGGLPGLLLQRLRHRRTSFARERHRSTIPTKR